MKRDDVVNVGGSKEVQIQIGQDRGLGVRTLNDSPISLVTPYYLLVNFNSTMLSLLYVPRSGSSVTYNHYESTSV